MIRRLVLGLLPRWRDAIEAESRRWMMQCPKCSFEISVWDNGGLRFKASGPVRRLARCRNCRRAVMMKVYLAPAPE